MALPCFPVLWILVVVPEISFCILPKMFLFGVIRPQHTLVLALRWFRHAWVCFFLYLLCEEGFHRATHPTVFHGTFEWNCFDSDWWLSVLPPWTPGAGWNPGHVEKIPQKQLIFIFGLIRITLSTACSFFFPQNICFCFSTWILSFVISRLHIKSSAMCLKHSHQHHWAENSPSVLYVVLSMWSCLYNGKLKGVIRLMWKKCLVAFILPKCVCFRALTQEEVVGKGELLDVQMMTMSETLTMTLLVFTRMVVPETTTMKIKRVTIATATTLSLMNLKEAQLIEGWDLTPWQQNHLYFYLLIYQTYIH